VSAQPANRAGPDETRQPGRFARRYGARPVHLAGYVAALAIAGYAVLQVAQLAQPWSALVWFVGAILLHDLVLFPAYTAADRVAQRVWPRRPRSRGPGVNVLRIPALLSGLLLLVWFPLILDRAPGNYVRAAGQQPPDYLERWLLISALLFAVSALVGVVRVARR
jgi:MFS family permease